MSFIPIVTLQKLLVFAFTVPIRRSYYASIFDITRRMPRLGVQLNIDATVFIDVSYLKVHAPHIMDEQLHS